MELKLTTRELLNNADILGILPYRRDELITICVDEMKKLFDSFQDSPINTVPFLVVIKNIAEHCKDLEEYTFSVIFTMREAARNGLLVDLDQRATLN